MTGPGVIEYSRREQRGWYLYDFANSAFATTVVTLFLGPYLTSLAKAAADVQGYVHPLGISVDARSFWSYAASLSVVLQVLILPVVGAIADYGRRKREVLALRRTSELPRPWRCSSSKATTTCSADFCS